MFEAFETLTYPPLYKLGIDSIYYLLKKFFIEPDLFIRELFRMEMESSTQGERTACKLRNLRFY